MAATTPGRGSSVSAADTVIRPERQWSANSRCTGGSPLAPFCYCRAPRRQNDRSLSRYLVSSEYAVIILRCRGRLIAFTFYSGRPMWLRSLGHDSSSVEVGNVDYRNADRTALLVFIERHAVGEIRVCDNECIRGSGPVAVIQFRCCIQCGDTATRRSLMNRHFRPPKRYRYCQFAA